MSKNKTALGHKILTQLGLGSFFKDWEMLTALMESEKDARVLTTIDGTVIFMNTRAQKFFNNKPLLTVIKERSFAEDGNRLALAKLEAAEKNHAETAVELALKPMKNDPESVEWFHVSIRQIGGLWTLWKIVDVTAKRSLDAVIRQEIQELGEFLDVLPVGLYQADAGGVLQYVNQRFSDWLGVRKAQDLRGCNLTELLIGSERPELDGLWHGELNFRTTAGSFFKAFVSHASYDENGETMLRGAVVRDAVQENDEKDAVNQAKTGFSWLFEEAPVGIAFVDMENVVTEGNSRLFQLFDKQREDVVGARLNDFINKADFNEMDHKLAKVKMGVLPRAHHHVKLIGTKTKRVAVVHFTPMIRESADGFPDISGVVVHFIDNTEQSNLEQQFSQAQKMQAVGQLAGGIAHDFNNLLTAVLGSVELLLETHKSSSPDFTELQNINYSANRAAELVGRLLSYSRQQSLKQEYLEVNELFSSLKHMLVRLLNVNKIETNIDIGRNVGYIRVDETQFNQVIINLAMNARDAMPDGGVFSVRTRIEKITATPRVGTEDIIPGEYVVIDISDTGCGMSAETQSRIFEPFYTTKSAGTDSGSGLGLAMVYGNIRQTDGYIRVKSAVGKGTTFSIYLPRHDAETVRVLTETKSNDIQKSSKSEMPPVVRIKPPTVREGDQLSFAFAKETLPMPAPLPLTNDLTGSARILLVEDEDGVRAVTKKSLTGKGYTVFDCTCAEEAIEKIDDHIDFDLLITDMVMPGMDGISLASVVKEKRPNARLLLISGFSEEGARGEIQNLPDLHFLAKPFSLKELGMKVKEILK